MLQLSKRSGNLASNAWPGGAIPPANLQRNFRLAGGISSISKKYDCAALPFAYSAFPMTVTESQARTFWFPLALTAATLLFFSRSFSSYFVCDDFQFLDRINFNNAGEYLTKSWGYNNEYRPFLPYTYALDAYIGGSSPYGYHITNTLLHVGSALFVAALAGLAGLRRSTAMLASVIFILNPAAHESVLWISGRPVVLSTFLVLACLLLFPDSSSTSGARSVALDRGLRPVYPGAVHLRTCGCHAVARGFPGVGWKERSPKIPEASGRSACPLGNLRPLLDVVFRISPDEISGGVLLMADRH